MHGRDCVSATRDIFNLDVMGASASNVVASNGDANTGILSDRGSPTLPNVALFRELVITNFVNGPVVVATDGEVDVFFREISGAPYLCARHFLTALRNAESVRESLCSIDNRHQWDSFLVSCKAIDLPKKERERRRRYDMEFQGLVPGNQSSFTVDQVVHRDGGNICVVELRTVAVNEADGQGSLYAGMQVMVGWNIVPVTLSRCVVTTLYAVASKHVASDPQQSSAFHEVHKHRGRALCSSLHRWFDHLQSHFSGMAPLSFRPPPEDDFHARRASKDSPHQAVAHPVQQAAAAFPLNSVHGQFAAPQELLGEVIESCGFTWVRGPEIGRGAMGKVLLGLQQKSGYLMAVKQVQAAGMDNAAEEIKALETEIVMFSRLRHPRVVQYFGTERLSDGNIRIFLEYLPGGSLQQMLQRFGALEEALVQRIMLQVLEGIQYLHSENICHRDIKAANILCQDLRSVKLADFGASKLKTSNQAQGADSAFKSLVGTPYMMAPEVIRQVGHDFKADIWSLGCCCYELLVGRPPWSQFKDRMAAMFHIANTNKPPDIPLNFTADCRSFMCTCLQLEPGKRPNADELLAHPWIKSVPVAPEEKEIKTPRETDERSVTATERNLRSAAVSSNASPGIPKTFDNPRRPSNATNLATSSASPSISAPNSASGSPATRLSSLNVTPAGNSPPAGAGVSGSSVGRNPAKKIASNIRSVFSIFGAAHARVFDMHVCLTCTCV
jgi:serine/threonine protein kinase